MVSAEPGLIRAVHDVLCLGLSDPGGCRRLALDVLDAIPDGWAKVDGKWTQITSDGVGYGEFDRVS